MSELKCPVCGKQMKIGTLDQDDSMGTVWMSIMPCDCVCSYGASKAVWLELIRTRKALGIAVDALNRIDKQLMTGIEMTYQARNALEKIKELEQKD